MITRLLLVWCFSPFVFGFQQHSRDLLNMIIIMIINRVDLDLDLSSSLILH